MVWAGRLVQAGGGKVLQDALELARRDGEIKEAVAAGAALGVELGEALGQPLVAVGVAEFAAVVEEALGEAGPDFVVNPGAGEFADGLFQLGAEAGVGLFAPGETDDGKRGGQVAIGGDIVERGDELAVGQIAGGAENDDTARLRHGPAGKALAQRIGGWCGGRVQSVGVLAPKPKEAK